MSAPDLLDQVLDHAEGLQFEHLPTAAVQAAVTFITDSVGVGLAGSRHPRLAQVRAAAEGWGQVAEPQGKGARDWASGQRWPAPTAALLNAYQVHNQEFDCVHERAVVHPLATILPALVAQAEQLGADWPGATAAGTRPPAAQPLRSAAAVQPVSGAQLIEALVLAVDLATTLGCAQIAPMRFFRPAMCGALGAALGAAKLAGCDRRQMADALGLAYSQLAGTMQAHSEGSPALALQVGFAARAAVMAVDLARAGFAGPHDVLQGPYGYFDLFDAPLAPRIEQVQAVFAEVFASTSASHRHLHRITEVSHKPFPTGRAAHGALDGLATLQAQHGFQTDAVQAIRLAAPPLILRLVGRPWRADMDVNYARLCLPYLAATFLRHGQVTLQHFEPAAVANPHLQALAERVSWGPNDVSDANALAPQTLSVILFSDETFNIHLPHVLGHPAKALAPAARQAKFDACCAFAGMGPAAAQALAQACAELPQLPDIRDWVECMQVRQRTSATLQS